jgi:hypothetical protein
MDLRFVAFNLIDGDALLRGLLSNYAHRLHHGRAPEGTAVATCFLVLKWAAAEGRSAPACTELLTAQVHIPRDVPPHGEYLDFVLSRLGAALTADAASRLITTRCLEKSDGDVENGLDSVFKSRTWEIAPAPSPRGGLAVTRLVPWPGGVQLGAAGLIAPGAGALSMN